MSLQDYPRRSRAARYPGVQLRERDFAAKDEAQRVLIAAAFALAPRGESTSPGCCTVDLQETDGARVEAAMHGLLFTLNSRTFFNWRKWNFPERKVLGTFVNPALSYIFSV